MESKVLPAKILFFVFILNLMTKTLADILIKSPNQLAEKFKGNKI